MRDRRDIGKSSLSIIGSRTITVTIFVTMVKNQKENISNKIGNDNEVVSKNTRKEYFFLCFPLAFVTEHGRR